MYFCTNDINKTSSQITMKQRDLLFDYIKGILILIVVYGHCLYWLDGTQNTPLYYSIPQIIYTFHMPLFIFLSGYFYFNKKNENLTKTIKIKFNRLILPHLFFNIVMIIPIFVFWNIYGHFITRAGGGINIKNIYLYITMFWYLWCVFLSCIITNYIYQSVKKYPEFVLVCIALLFNYLTEVLPISIFFKDQQIGEMFLYFSLGIVLHDHIKYLFSKQVFCYASIVYIAYLYTLFFCPQYINIYISEMGRFAGLLCSLNIFKLLYRIGFAKNYFLHTAQWTLGIYIYHFVVLSPIMECFNNKLHIFGNTLIIINLIISIITTKIISKVIERLHRFKIFRKYALGEKN